MSSILRYIGAKNIPLYDKIKDDYVIYCEPFSGSFSTGFKLISDGFKGRTIYNDLDENVVNFWKCVQEDSQKVYNYYEIYTNKLNKVVDNEEKNNMLNEMLYNSDKFVRAAAEYLYRQHLTMKGISWAKEKIHQDKYDFFIEEMIIAQTEIFNYEYDKIIKYFDDCKTFLMIDPPYEIKSVNRYYRGECKEFNHDELANIVYSLDSGWLLTYNDNEHIRALYKRYNIYEVTRELMGNKYTELYITNTDIKF